MLTCTLKNYIYHKGNRWTVNKCVQVGKPEDRTASERARQAATDKFPFSICSEPKSFSKMGQKTLSSESIESSAAGSVAMDMGRWLNTVPILNLKDYKWEKEMTTTNLYCWIQKYLILVIWIKGKNTKNHTSWHKNQYPWKKSEREVCLLIWLKIYSIIGAYVIPILVPKFQLKITVKQVPKLEICWVFFFI